MRCVSVLKRNGQVLFLAIKLTSRGSLFNLQKKKYLVKKEKRVCDMSRHSKLKKNNQPAPPILRQMIVIFLLPIFQLLTVFRTELTKYSNRIT